MTTIKEPQEMTIKELNEHLFYHWDTLGKVQKEVNRRLTDGEEAVKMNNDLKCCGNCVDSYNSCPQMKEQDLLPFNSCEHWQWDNMTAAERIKG